MKTVRDLGEFGLIAKLCEDLPACGDDCAVLPAARRDRYLLFTCDPVIENIHYLPETPAYRVGWKAMARNLSDIAAMSGLPRYAVVSLGLRPETPVRYVTELYRGLRAAANRFHCEVVGGDTAHVRGDQFIVIAMLGEVEKHRLVRRRGARPGDVVFVTGPLGGSFASGHHLTFTPRIREARWLTAHYRVHAMLDLSDGLASDLQRLIEAGGVGFALESAKIPCRTTLNAALTEGEDFELLFTVSPRDAASLRKRFHEIGRVIPKPVILLDDQPLRIHGYDHFRSK
ncbi:MAG: thiamine-phosphate kinase [Verrucomicrobiae bacterium]|nr:thiamine-phosphate kinase [Verrucomicrobiae bacterium]